MEHTEYTKAGEHDKATTEPRTTETRKRRSSMASQAAGYTELTWAGTNADEMAAFTDSRSEVRPMRDGIPNVLVVHGRRGVRELAPEDDLTGRYPHDVPTGRYPQDAAGREPYPAVAGRDPYDGHVITASAPRSAAPNPRSTVPDRRQPAEPVVTVSAPRATVDEALTARIGDTVMKSPTGTLFVRTPEGTLHGNHEGYLRDLFREEPLAPALAITDEQKKAAAKQARAAEARQRADVPDGIRRPDALTDEQKRAAAEHTASEPATQTAAHKAALDQAAREQAAREAAAAKAKEPHRG